MLIVAALIYSTFIRFSFFIRFRVCIEFTTRYYSNSSFLKFVYAFIVMTQCQDWIGLATGVMRSLRQPLWRHSSISLETKLRVYQASVLSVLLYGSECWPISTSLCNRLSAFDMHAQRAITNTKWFEYKTNIEVRTLTNRQPIQRYIAQGRLRWLGHLLRSPSNHPALAIYTFNPRAAGWSRPRGAPRTRWSDVLGKDLKQLGTTLMEASNIALDRSRWRSTIVARVVSTPSWQEP